MNAHHLRWTPKPKSRNAAAELLPGRYNIEWGRVFGSSVLVNPAGFAEYERSETLSLVAGHVYTLRADRTTGHGYRIYFWIEDETTNTVVAGTKMP